MIFNRRDLDTKQRFGIRKLSVGVCSVLLSTLFLTFNTNQLVHADSTDKNNTGAQTTEVTRDPQSARNSKSTSHIEQNQFQSRSEAADTQVSETKDLAQTKTNKTDLEIAVKSSDKTEEKQSELELTQVEKPTEEQKTTVSPANLDKENQREIETTTLKLDKANAGKLDAKVLAESKVTTQEDTTYSLPEDFTDADLVQQIHLVHAHGVTSQYTSRQITVHYVYGAGEHAGEQAAQDAVLDIYYKRTGDTDLVTNTMAADAPWLFDSSYNEDGYQNGYKVVSGDWSQLPTNWANVVANVPTIDGYKAFTSGDWTKVGSNVSTVAANEFVNPAYNAAGEGGGTISGKNSIAYTDAAKVYEATANHTIYYVPAKQTETRTVKKYFKLYDPTTNTYKAADVITLSDGTKQDYGQIDIYYDRQATRFATNGSTDPSKWTTSYGDWNVDTTRGNLGVKVVSGSWSDNLTAGSQGSINMPSLPGYTVVAQSSDLGSLTYNIGTINGGSGSFTGTTGPWYYRNSTTTFYVPNSLLQKTITRTINIEGQSQPITQQVTFYRTAFINADDTEIVLAAVVDNNVYKREFGDNVWNHESTDKDGIPTGTWNRVDVTKPGYTAIVDDQAVTEVAADSTVNPNMSNATVNVTYIKNAGTITINHAKVDKTYSGDPTETTIPNDITHAIDKTDSRITWPTGAEDVTLDNSDFSFANEDGTALTNIPVNVGTYHIILNQNGINKFKNLDPDFTWYYDPKTSYVVYKINKAVPNVTFQGAGTKTYDGTAINNYTTPIGLAITDAPNAGENSITLTAGTDYVWYATDAQGHKVGEAIKTAPVNVGNYAIELTDTGKNAIKNATANANNLDWAKAKISGTGTYKITEATAKATLSGENSRDYNGLAVSTDDLYAGTNGNITVTIAIPNSNETISYTLKNDDYTWDTPDHVAPTDQGTYTFTLNKDEVLAGLQAAIAADPEWKGNVGISADDLTGSATFTINPATGTATLSGSAYKTYDGKDVSLDDLNSPDGDIEVKFTFPGSTTADTYKLQAGDYTVENNSANVGDYIVKLTNTGFAHLNAGIAKYAGAGNVTLGEDNLKGQASFTIKPKDLTVTLDKKPNTIPGKTYDGDPATIDDNDAQLTADGLVIGESLNTANLTPSDYEWVDENGKKLDKIPTDAGTYYIALTQAGKDQLQKDNPNYNVSESGKFAYVISPKKVDVTVQGGQESTDTAINNGKFSLNVPAGVTIPNGMTYDFANGTPTESGVYQVALSPTSQTALKNANPNYTLNIKPGGKFTLDATVTFTFQDTDENNKQVGDVVTKTGVAGSIAKNHGLSVPAGYELATGESLPSDYTFGKTLQQTVFIKLTHIKKTIEHTDPIPDGEKTPTGKPIDGAHEDDLNQTITRTINVKNPDGTTDTTTQTAHIYRDASYDDVTGDVTYGTWSEDSTNWKEFTTPTIDGYTPSKETVPAITVKDGQGDETVNITYTPNKQTTNIIYKDKNGNDVQIDKVDGKTDETVKVDSTIPAGWKLVDGQEPAPETVKFGPNGHPDIVIEIEHNITKVPHDKPVPEDGKTPTGKPIDGAHEDDLNQTITRTINVKNPDGTTDTTTQTAHIYRDASYDDVTGDVTYGTWSEDSTNWKKFTTPTIEGYAPSQAEVSALEVKNGQKNVTIIITYSPVEQTGKISYQDKDGNEIGTSPLKGKTDEPIKVDPTKDVPAGWEIVPDQDIPKTVTATPDGIPTVIVKIQHKKVTVTPKTPEGKIPTGKVPGDPAKTYPKLQDLTKKPTRTITIIKPDGTKGVVSQEVTFTRTATFDEVTGDVTYTDWKFKDSNASDTTKSQWDAYTPAAISGYTADPASVAAKAVSVDTGNVEITIIYKPIGGGGDDQPEGPDTPPATNPGPTEPGNGGQPTTAPTTPPVPGKPGDTTGKPSLPNVPGTTPGVKPKPELKPIKPIKTVKKSKITTKVQAEDTVRKNAPAKPNNVTDNAPLHMDQAAAPKGANVANVKKNALPQTGEKHEENSMGWLGSLLASLGLFSLIGAKKRKKRDAE